MKKRPAFELSRLRKIGWQRWDPIGLAGLEGTPDDEYDTYLMQAAGRLWNDSSEAEVIDYLIGIETEYMGLDDRPDVRRRAREVVRDLAEYVSEVRGKSAAAD